MPDWDNTESRESDEDATWRDLVARFDAPLSAEHPVPWPTREDVPDETHGASGTDTADPAGADAERKPPGGDGNHRPDGDRSAGGRDGLPGAGGRDGLPGAGGPEADLGPGGLEAFPGVNGPNGYSGGLNGGRGEAAPDGTPGAGWLSGNRSAAGLNSNRTPGGSDDKPGGAGGRSAGRHGKRGPAGRRDPEVIQVPRTIRGPVRDDGEHFIPPAPPPLPKLDPVAKGAWAALFGGPGYLVVATAAGWSVSGVAAFCAVAAFVAGFAILVLRMHDPGPGGPDDGDDGAVI